MSETNDASAVVIGVYDLDGKKTRSNDQEVVLPTTADLKFQNEGKIMDVLWALLLAFSIIMLVLLLVKIANAQFTNFTYTYDLPSNTPGSLLDSRFSFYYWLLILSTSVEILVIIWAFARIAIPWAQAYNWLHTIFSGIAIIIEFIAFIGILIISKDCNNDALNPCRSEFFCAANSVVNDPLLTPLGCPLISSPYSIAILKSDLTWNSIFRNNFGFTCAMLFLVAGHFIIGIVISWRFDIIFKNVLIWTEMVPNNNNKPDEANDETNVNATMGSSLMQPLKNLGSQNSSLTPYNKTSHGIKKNNTMPQKNNGLLILKKINGKNQ